MKIRKLFMALGAATLLALPSFAELPENLTFSISVDAAYYPASDMKIAEKKTHFAPLTGAYSGAEARVCGDVDYKIATPLGSNWLVSDANVVLNGSLELTPISIKPSVKVAFTPVPFIVFSTGASFGYGWDLPALNFKGMAVYDSTEKDYVSVNTIFYEWWAQGTFQFDTGALFPGDWTHVVMLYSYRISYENLAGIADNSIFTWQGSGEKVAGLQNYQSAIIAYQMPLVLYRVGAMLEIGGYFNGEGLPSAYDPSFKSISISPLAQFKLSEKDTLNVLCSISSRRCFENVPAEDSKTQTFELTKTSREWYFNRIALSYSHTF